MHDLIDTRPDISVQDAEYQRLLGYPTEHVLEGRALELVHRTREWFAENGRPWIYARHVEALELTDNHVIVGGMSFTSKQLHDQFKSAEAHGVFLVAVSAGAQCEEKARELWTEGKPDEYFFMEMYGSAVVEHLITTTGGRICAWADEKGMFALPHYSPGYSGWDITDQNRLWKLINHGQNGSFPGELHVMDSGMLRPKKSLLAVFGFTRRVDLAQIFKSLVPCENCSLNGCAYRRMPYRNSLPQIEDVRRLQAAPILDTLAKLTSTFPLNPNAKYSVNARALQKWSQERLHLKILRDGTIDARFHYEGTTCSNMGQPLEYDYHIKLSPPAYGYRIIEADCAPSPGDTGHTSQCEFLNDSERFVRDIANEKPFLGQPLDSVLAWQRPYDPSGCYCDINRRMHKWGLAYEVLHFALVQHHKEAVKGPANSTSK
jgi:hypothetical protein